MLARSALETGSAIKSIVKKLNIAKIIDQFGWAYYFLDKEQKKYSRHNIIIQKYDQICLNNIDILYIHSPDISPETKNILPMLSKERKIKTIGAYGAHLPHLYPNIVDVISTISPTIYDYAKKNYIKKPVLFLPEFVDDNFFKPNKVKHSDFKVGFAGRLTAVKRPHILDTLKYPVIKRSEWGSEYFVENRPHDSMVDFYNSIDVLVLTSMSEAMPRVVLEAMACGIPVIATRVGSIPLMIENSWIVDVVPEEETIKQINQKLELLEKNPSLREQIGNSNRKRIEKHLSWRNNINIWDTTFDLIYKGNYGVAERISNQTMQRLKSFLL